MPSPARSSVLAIFQGLLRRLPQLATMVTATAFLAMMSPAFAAVLTFSPTSLPAGAVGLTYEQSITASGSVHSLYYDLSSGALPTGLSLSPSFGMITGIPTATGTFNFIVHADDGINSSGTQAYSITIAEAAPTLSINDVTLAEGNSGTTAFTFTISLSAPAPTGGVTFDIATSDYADMAGSDYTAKSLPSQTIAAGTSTYTFTVLVNGDTRLESDETFFVSLTNITGAIVGDGQGTGTITNDDASADLNVEITASPASIGSDSRVTYTIVLKNEGESTAVNPRLSLALPAGMSMESFIAPPGWTASNSMATTSALAGGESVAFRVDTFVYASYPNGTELQLAATAASDTEDNDLADNQATASTTFAPSADLKLSLTPPHAGSLLPGQPAVYTVTVTNDGPMDAASVAVYAKLSGRAALTSSTPAEGWSTGDFTSEPNDLFFTGALESGESVNLTLTASVDADASQGAGVQLYLVAGSIGTSDPTPDDNTLTHHALVGPALATEEAIPLGSLAAGKRVTGNLYPVGTIDVYAFTAQAGDRLYAATATTASSGNDHASRDTVLTVVDANGATVLEVDDDDGALSSTASSLAGVPLPASGTYYLLVSCQRPRQVVFPYDLYVRLQSRTPAEETSATANAPGQTLSGAHWVGGVVQSGAETDTYQVTLNAGDTIFASLDLDPTRTGRGWDGRLSLNPLSAPSRIFAINGSDAHRIHQPDNDTPPGSEALLLTVKDAGTYSLAVSSVDGNHGAYHLSVSIIPAATENASATYPATLSNHEIGDGGTLTSTLAIPTAQRIGKLKVGLNLAHANLPDLDVHLTAPSGNTVGLFRNVSDAAHTTLDVILDDGAAYAIGFDQEDADNPLPEVAGAIFKPGRDYRLAWFAGQQAQGSWTLTIRDRHSDGKTGTLNNWSLTVIADDELPGGTETVHYASDFENSNGGFVASSDNSPNQWNHGTPAAAPIASAHSGTKAWKTNLTGNYDSSSNQDLFSPEIDLTDVSSRNPIVLSWAMNYQLGDASQDGAYIEVQEVGGSNLARVVWRWLGSAMRDTGVGFNSTTIEEAAGWGVHRALISDFAGKMVRVRFHLDRNSGDDFAGLAIDDVSIASYHDAPPTVLTVVRHHNASATTAAGTLMYRVQFSEPVQNVTSTSFGLTSVGGNVSGTISSVVGSGSVYYVTVTGVTGSGALRMDVLSGTIANENGRVLVNGFTSGQSYTRVASVRAYAWGSNSSGKLGNGTMFSRPLPGFVQTGGASALAGKTVAALAYGGEHTLALDSAGKAYAWGNNVQRQLGDGSNDGASLPLAVSTTGALAGKTIVAIAAGYVHSLALDSDGHVYSWGYNTAGELGLGSTAENIGEPTQVAGLLSGKTIVAIAAGRNHSLALASDGSLYAWGSANEAQLGNGVSGNNAKSNVPVGVTMTGALVGKTIVGISAGLYHNLVLASDGTAYGWGWNSTGQLGDGGHFEASEPVAVDIGSSSALEGKTLIAVAAGTDHSLALDSAGKVYAWGFNISGQLGTSNGAGPHYLPRGVNLPSSVIATAISAGADHSFALTSDGVLYGWGSSSNGQLGNGSWDDQPSPVLVDTSATSALQGASVLALGSGGSFADDALVIGQTSQPVVETLTTPDTGAYKLGRTLVFELTADRAVTVNTHGGTPRLVLSFDSGEVYADYVATSEDGKRLRFSYAVNDGDSGSSGIGLEPYLDLNGGSIVDAADGTLALTPVFAAPDLGGIVVDAIAPTIRSINRAGGAIEATGLTTVAFNVIFSEAVNSDGEELSVENFSVVALGGNVSGRVSDVRLVAGAGEGRAARSAGRSRRSGATIYRATVADLAGEGEFAIALSSSHLIGDVAGNLLTGSVTSQSYTRFEHASAFAWGEGGDGQLGNGNSETSDVPVALHANGALAGKAIVALAHGAHHTLALTSDGQVYGWGKNSDGQLAIENDFIAEPVAISPTGALNGKFVVAIAAGDSFSVALTSEGEVITWGRNESGELGIDSDDDFNAVPTLVDLSRFDSPRIVAIATGTHHVLALAENGNVYAWGANNVGQLGNEETSEAEPAPVRAYPSNAVAAVSAGANHSLALTFEGEVLSWGGNEAGQLGDGSTEDRLWSENVAFPDLDSGEQPADGIASIVAGDRYSLALTVDGRLFAWGANDTGQLGSSNHDNFSEPSHVTLWNDVRLATIAPGRNHVLALATDGTVYGWGDNTHRQLALLDDEVFRQPFRLELTGITRAYVLGSGVAADHGTLLGAVSPAFHSADTNHDWSLSLLELTRVVELYNARDGTTRTGEYHTQLGTEDGFASGAGTITAYHSADTNHDGKLSLLELTRVIELYNTYDRTSRTGVYHATEFGTEDGFAPGPSVRS